MKKLLLILVSLFSLVACSQMPVVTLNIFTPTPVTSVSATPWVAGTEMALASPTPWVGGTELPLPLQIKRFPR